MFRREQKAKSVLQSTSRKNHVWQGEKKNYLLQNAILQHKLFKQIGTVGPSPQSPLLQAFSFSNCLWCDTETLTSCQVVASRQTQLSTLRWWKSMQERVRQRKGRVAVIRDRAPCRQWRGVKSLRLPFPATPGCLLLAAPSAAGLSCSQHCLSPSSGALNLT